MLSNLIVALPADKAMHELIDDVLVIFGVIRHEALPIAGREETDQSENPVPDVLAFEMPKIDEDGKRARAAAMLVLEDGGNGQWASQLRIGGFDLDEKKSKLGPWNAMRTAEDLDATSVEELLSDPATSPIGSASELNESLLPWPFIRGENPLVGSKADGTMKTVESVCIRDFMHVAQPGSYELCITVGPRHLQHLRALLAVICLVDAKSVNPYEQPVSVMVHVEEATPQVSSDGSPVLVNDYLVCARFIAPSVRYGCVREGWRSGVTSQSKGEACVAPGRRSIDFEQVQFIGLEAKAVS